MNDASAPTGLMGRLRQGLGRTRNKLQEGLGQLFSGGPVQLDDELSELLEDQLLMADVGVETTTRLMRRLREILPGEAAEDSQAVIDGLAQAVEEILTPCEMPLEPVADKPPYVVLVVGINGSGKTTTIGKLARRLRDEGRSVMLAAGDTFRAAAVEQLQIWGQRNEIPVIAQHAGADSAAVIHDAFAAARARGTDVLIADTAGRLHTQDNLMEELRKIRRVLQRQDPAAPHEVLLVLDAGTGQNALSQAREFHQAVGVSGIALTKLDGTARGGIVLTIADQLGIPLRFIGIGEKAEDLRVFNAHDFARALLASAREEAQA